MSDIFTFSLRGKVSGGASLEFVEAQMSTRRRTPFVLIRYEENGVIPRYGLRLDLDKRAFLDHFEDMDKEVVMREAAPKIAAIVGEQLTAMA